MKLTLTIALFFCLCSGFGQEKINNSSVIQLVKQGFDPEIIITKINHSETAFDISIKGLQELKSGKVPQDIIKLMMDRSIPETILRSGIYFDQGLRTEKIAPSVFSGEKSNVFAAALTFTLVPLRTKLYLNGRSSSDRVSQYDDQVFIFQFNEDRNEYDLGGANFWFRNAESPKEFALTKLKQKKKKNRRQLLIGTAGVFSATRDGVNPRKTIAFRSEYLGGGKFEVRPVSPLSPGEYFFFYQNALTSGNYREQVIFDFSVE